MRNDDYLAASDSHGCINRFLDFISYHQARRIRVTFVVFSLSRVVHIHSTDFYNACKNQLLVLNPAVDIARADKKGIHCPVSLRKMLFKASIFLPE